MKIAITGHTNGIGKALAKQYEQRGYEIVGLSRRNGFNIRSIPKILEQISDCEVFINNAQAGYSQTELLYAVYEKWYKQEGKFILNISTMATMLPTCWSDEFEMDQYRTQKVALEEAHRQLLRRLEWPKLCLIKPGEVNTGDHSGPMAVDPDVWAKAVVDILESVKPTMEISELSLGVNYHNG